MFPLCIYVKMDVMNGSITLPIHITNCYYRVTDTTGYKATCCPRASTYATHHNATKSTTNSTPDGTL